MKALFSIVLLVAMASVPLSLSTPLSELQNGGSVQPSGIQPEKMTDRARRFKIAGLANPFPRPILTVWDAPASYDRLLADSGLVVLGAFVEEKSRLSGDLMAIETVCRFRVSQVVAGHFDWSNVKKSERILPGAVMKPLGDDELFVIRVGGKLDLFGVQMQDIETAFPLFKLGQQYILFLQPYDCPPQFAAHYGYPDVKVYKTSAGPHGVVVVNRARGSAFTAKPFINNPDLRTELEQRLQSDLTRFLRYLRKQ
jgi:hypothetical protein